MFNKLELEKDNKMDKIFFPGLNIKLQISKIALTIGNLDIYWYAILMVFAFIIALVIFKIKDGQFEIRFNNLLDLCIILIPVSIVSARIYYIIFKLDYYVQNPLQLINLRNGGLAIYGGIIGGVITCYIFCKKKKINFLDLLDYMAPCLALRSSNRKMGKLHKYRGLWNKNKFTMENGNF